MKKLFEPNGNILMVTLISLMMVACGDESETTNNQKDSNVKAQPKTQVVEENTLSTSNMNMTTDNPDYVIGTDLSNAPFEMRGEQGSIIGLDVDMIDYVARTQDFTYRFFPMKWNKVFNKLDTEEIDIISGIVVMTDERQQKYDFTDPIFYKKRFAYMKSSVMQQYRVTEFSDICKLKVAVKGGTDKEALYDKICGKDNPNKLTVASNMLSFRKMTSDVAQVSIGDDILFTPYIHKNNLTDIVTIPDPSNTEIPLAWPVKKGDTELVTKFNAGLKEMKQKGIYDELIDKWLGEDFLY